MGIIEDDHRRRRLKRVMRGWKQLRNPRVLKTVFWTGMVIYRVVRWVYENWIRFSG